MILKPTSHTVCRTPVFSLGSKLNEVWPVLKEIIAASSPEFFQCISDLEFHDLERQPEKVQFTIWKYFNRARYRATPFGQFAGISLVPIVKQGPSEVVLEKAMNLRNWPCWTSIPKHRAVSMEKGACFRTNPTGYFHQSAYCFLYRAGNDFLMKTIACSNELEKIVSFCGKSRSHESLLQFLQGDIQIGPKRALTLIKELLEMQVIHSDVQPNITGPDYFSRIGDLSPFSVDQYSISCRAVCSGQLSQSSTQEISEYLAFISRCMPELKQVDLLKFKADFLGRWEQQSVPFAIALDPLAGIGYGEVPLIGESELLSQLEERAGRQQTIGYGPFQQFLLKGIIKGEQIRLEEFQPNDSLTDLSFPNTLSVQVHWSNGQPVISTAGGASATALIGRFSSIEEFNTYGRYLANLEQRANPDAIFFDIAYECEGRVDNVNRREHLYETELSFSAWSTLDEPLHFQDIMISVRGGQIVLHHAKTGARLVPRHCSAYNYNRSDLHHFRFLSDLQYQGHFADLRPNLSAIFPGMPYYPRVCYKHCIINPAQWLLPKMHGVAELRQWLKVHQIVGLLKVGHGDQTLVFDPSLEQDIHFLFLYQKQQTGTVFLTEALIDHTTKISDQQGKHYHGEFILDFYHDGLNYRSFENHKEEAMGRSLFLPGEEWVYIALYLHPLLMDGFLLNEIKPLVSAGRNLIKQWFFIRYKDPDDHLRLRIKLKDKKDLPLILDRLSTIISKSQHIDQLKNMQIRVYDREIHRYGIKQIDLVEHFFYQDSRQALVDLRLPVEERYVTIVQFVSSLVERLFATPGERLEFLREMAGLFADEMRFEISHFKKINASFKSHQEHFGKEGFSLNHNIALLFDRLMDQYDGREKARILADLIHLHINRRFYAKQRLHEAIIYQFLFKHFVSRKPNANNMIKVTGNDEFLTRMAATSTFEEQQRVTD